MLTVNGLWLVMIEHDENGLRLVGVPEDMAEFRDDETICVVPYTGLPIRDADPCQIVDLFQLATGYSFSGVRKLDNVIHARICR